MFQLSNAFLGRPVMSLRTGGRLGETVDAIINPNNLKIEGFYCNLSGKKQRAILLSQDIRDVVPQGIAVNDAEVLSEPEDLVRLKDILNLNFKLIGKPVFSDSKKRLGKVGDYAVEIETMYINKIYVSQSVIKNLAGGGLAVDRNQILEITNRKIVIQEPLQGTPSPAINAAPLQT